MAERIRFNTSAYQPDRAYLCPVQLAYDASDSFAVTLGFRPGDGQRVEWVFARDLLARGLCGNTGWGDVRVACTDGRWVHITLRSHEEGVADLTFLLRRVAVSLFLKLTYRVVPRGAEKPDVDRAIAAILAGGDVR